MTTLLYSGFANPVRDSQAVFRAVLNAMALPGRIHTLATPASPPPPLDRATAAIMLTLLDNETSIWMDEPSRASREWVAFQCGTRFSSPAEAQFAVALSLPSFSDFSSGSDEEPEASATLILQIASLGQGQSFRLEGPGLQHPCVIALGGLDHRFQAQWQANRDLSPRGIDIILCAGDQIAALPRTTRLELA